MSQQFPKISIVTPTFNSERFLEITIQSILGQNYPNLEYIIIDGGSTDGTLDIIKKYEDKLAYWQSEADEGMYHAIQKGFEHATGDIMAWLNSDDFYLPWTFITVAEVFTSFSEIEWLASTHLMIADEEGIPKQTLTVKGYSYEGFFQGEHTPLKGQAVFRELVQQESTFWRRSLWERTGASLNLRFKYAGDAELWLRFVKETRLYGVRLALAAFRKHDSQISSRLKLDYHQEMKDIRELYGIKEQKAYYKFWRTEIASLFHHKIRKIASWIGALHPTWNCYYDMEKKQWMIKKDYY